MKDTAHLKGFGRLSTLLIAQGYSPVRSYRFERFVNKLMKHRGPRGAILYLSALGDQCSKELTGWPEKDPSQTWVRKSHYYSFRKYGNVHLLRRLTKIKRHIIYDRPTPEQVIKFLGAVERPDPDEGPVFTASSLVQRGMESIRSSLPIKHNWKSRKSHISYVKRELASGQSPKRALERAFTRLTQDVQHLAYMGFLDDPEIMDLVCQSLRPFNRDEVIRLCNIKVASTRVPSDTVGTVHGTQEPGGKLRCYGAPRLIYQDLLEPLKEYLMMTLQALDTDACFKVDKAVEQVRLWIENGDTVYSLDQSNATDSFPLILLLVALMQIKRIPAVYIKLFRLVCEGNWAVSEDLVSYFERTIIRWFVGQPLGSGPSFGAYSVAHHGYIRGLCDLHGVPYSDYWELGDDFVTRNALLARVYRNGLDAMGVKISMEKSVVSETVAEFAGYTITSKAAFRPGKWREVTEDSLLQFVMEPGYDYKLVLPRFWVPLIERMRETCYPFGLHKPDLVSLNDDGRFQFVDSVINMFTRTLIVNDTIGELDEINETPYFDNGCLYRAYVKYNRIAVRLYDELREHPMFSQLKESHVQRYRTSFLITNTFPGDPPRVEWFATDTFGRLFQRTFPIGHPEVLQRGSSRVEFLRPGGSGMVHYTTSKEELSLGKLPIDVYTQLQDCANLVWSFVSSLTPQNVETFGSVESLISVWIASVPFLRDLYKTSTSLPEPLDIVRDCLAHFPFYGLKDFSQRPRSFITRIRRYAQAKDILPSTRVPLPRKRVR